MANENAPFSDLPSLDPAKRAKEGLDDVISSSNAEEVVIVDEKLKEKQQEWEKNIAEKEKSEETVEVSRVMHATPILEHRSDRQKVRLLILTRDVTVTDAGSLAQKRMIELSDMFAEIHIVVLSMKGDGLEKTTRIAGNVWVYPTNSRRWWRTVLDAYKIVNEQLNFAQGFRADMILAEDPFESGLVGYHLAEKYSRPFQIHVFEDFFDPTFKDRKEHNNLRLYMARYTLNRVDCVRTKSEYIKDRIIEKFKGLKEYTEVLPIYYNLKAWREAVPTFDLKEKYPQFKFFLLHVSTMTPLSHTDRVITGAARILKQYPIIGLIVVGDGPDRARLEKFVVTLGLSNQVIFETAVHDSISYMKSSNILLYLSEEAEEEYIVLQAAAVGLPIITGVAGLPGELFLDGESAFVCPNDSPPCIGEKVNKYLNENQLRNKFSRNAQETVFERIDQNYEAYMEAYRDSIERCMVLGG